MNSFDVDPELFVPQERQFELIDAADSGMTGTAIRLAIREAVATALTGLGSLPFCHDGEDY